MSEHEPIDPTVLPDEPDVWGTNDQLGYIQRWRAGAFGDRTNIRGAFRFVVEEDEWDSLEDDIPRRTIIKAKITQ